MSIKQRLRNGRVKFREKMNGILGPLRIKKINNKNFTIICNNCWGGHVYRYFNMEYTSPTVGLYLYSDDYIKFIYNLKHYMQEELSFIDFTQSRYKDDLMLHNNIHCPIGKLDDIEIVFLHYRSREEALTKWNRRKKRIVWDNIVYKMSEQNLCSLECLHKFDSFSADRKLVFVTDDYGLKSQVLWGSECQKKNISIDTVDFRKYVDLVRFINGDSQFRKKQSYAKMRLAKLNNNL